MKTRSLKTLSLLSLLLGFIANAQVPVAPILGCVTKDGGKPAFTVQNNLPSMGLAKIRFPNGVVSISTFSSSSETSVFGCMNVVKSSATYQTREFQIHLRSSFGEGLPLTRCVGQVLDSDPQGSYQVVGREIVPVFCDWNR
jgi:hypothetical protein